MIDPRVIAIYKKYGAQLADPNIDDEIKGRIQKRQAGELRSIGFDPAKMDQATMRQLQQTMTGQEPGYKIVNGQVVPDLPSGPPVQPGPGSDPYVGMFQGKPITQASADAIRKSGGKIDPLSQGGAGPKAGPGGAGPAGPAAGAGPAGGSPAGGASGTPNPSAPAGTTGLSIGQVEDYQAMVVSMLQSLGFDSLAQDYQTADLTTDSSRLSEIAGYAKAKVDRGGLEQLLRNRPDLVAINPGLPYKLTKEQYTQQRGEVERAAANLGTTASGDMSHGSETAAEAEAFKEGMTPAEIEAGMASQFKRLGTAPSSAQDVQAFRTRPTQDTTETRVKPPVQQTEAGPAQTTLSGPKKNYVGARRK